MSAARVRAHKLINDHPVVIFSKTWCPYCQAAKALLTGAGARFYAFELDLDIDGEAILAALKEMNKKATIPDIYIKRTHIGGYTELVGTRSRMMPLLIAAGAVPQL